MIGHWLRSYWDWAGSNIGAAPACGILAVLFAVCFQKPIAKWWHKHLGYRADLAEIRDIASAAHRIAADTFRHHTGHDHPDAPGGEHEQS